MRMSDVIEKFIKDMLKDDDEFVEIQRNELAQHFNCVPSQINYVISTRFKPSQGYYVESKRRWRGTHKNKKNKHNKKQLPNAHNNKHRKYNFIKRNRYFYKQFLIIWNYK